MTILAFAVAAFVVGALLGLCFKVFILASVPAVSLAAVAGVGFKYDSSFGFAFFVIFLGITALQIGYLFGSVLGIYIAAAYEQRHRPGTVEPEGRHFRQSQT